MKAACLCLGASVRRVLWAMTAVWIIMNVRVITVRTEHAVWIMWPDTHASVLRDTGESKPLYISPYDFIAMVI